MLILILIDVQYSQKAVFSFEKGLNRQNHCSSGFLHPVKKSSLSKISDPPHPPGICNKTETKNVTVAKMVEFIKTCNQHSRSLTLVIFSAS